MLAEERLSKILDLVNLNRNMTVQDLTDRLKTSESTVRRDLTVLHNRGLLIKVHGGATAINTGYNTKDLQVAERQSENREDKIKIAEYAASLIEPDDFVYIDAGTTTELIIDFITRTEAVYVTNGVAHARKLAARGCRVFLPGGELKAFTDAIVGPEAIDSLSKYNFTKGFWGTNGVTAETGFTTPDLQEALVKKAAMKQCRDRYIVCDKSKFNRIAPVRFASFQDAVIITVNLGDPMYKKAENIREVKQE